MTNSLNLDLIVYIYIHTLAAEAHLMRVQNKLGKEELMDQRGEGLGQFGTAVFKKIMEKKWIR